MAARKKTPVKEVVETKVSYRVLVGINYGSSRFEPGDLVDTLPEDSLGWLLEQNVIEKVED